MTMVGEGPEDSCLPAFLLIRFLPLARTSAPLGARHSKRVTPEPTGQALAVISADAYWNLFTTRTASSSVKTLS